MVRAARFLVPALVGVWHPLVYAHVPHDVVASVAAPADLDPTLPWFVLLSGPVPQLVQSGDGARHFTALGGPPMGDAPLGVALLHDTVLVVLGSTRLWWLVEGEWSSEPLPAQVSTLAVTPSGVLLAGAGGAYAGMPGALEAELDVPLAGARGGDFPTAWGIDGELWSWTGASWENTGVLPGAIALSSNGLVELVGTAEGLVARRDVGNPAWADCGAIPGVPSAVVQLVVTNTDAWAATGLGLFRSRDGCASWEAVESGVTIEYEGAGSPDVPTDVFTSLFATPSTVVLGGWYGLRIGGGGGQTWTRSALVRPDCTRGLAVVGSGPRVYTGPYASGPLASPDGGRTWSAANHGARDTNTQEVLAHGEAPDTVYALVNHDGTISRDGGANWSKPELAVAVDRFSLGLAARDVFAMADGLYSSHDEGRTWSEVAAFESVDATDAGQVLPLADGTTCVRSDNSGGLWCAEGGAGAFGEVVAPGADLVRGAATTWPVGNPSWVVVASGTDVASFQPSTGARSRLTLLDTDRFSAVAVADDDTLLAGTATGQLLVSRDGGVDWRAVPLDLPAGVLKLAPAPQFGNSGEVVVATAAGNWLVTLGADDEAVVEAFAPALWVDDSAGFVSRPGCADPVTDRSAALDTLTALAPGCELRLAIYGSAIAVSGRGDGSSRGDLTLDGERSIALSGNGDSEVWELAAFDVEEGWHDLVIRGIDGEGLYVDYVFATSPGATLTRVEEIPLTGEVAECGCGAATRDSSLLGAWLSAAGLVVRRRPR